MTFTYWAILDGTDSALTLLADCFNQPGCQVQFTEERNGTKNWTLRSSELVFEKPGDEWDTVKAWMTARVHAMNGAARLQDPWHHPVRIREFRCRGAGGGPTEIHENWDWDPGPFPPRPPRTPEAQDLVRQWAELALADKAVAKVLMVLTMPPTWTALGLVLDAIKHDLGGQKYLEHWMGKPGLRQFTGSINFARNLAEGPRHMGKIDEKWNREAALPLWEAHGIVRELARQWIGSKIDRVAEHKPR
ncbi:hypothetical protein FHW79_006406 [Azospirillum sp. OGB3]|uniref:hypothetical protein n=1 Tax=Azospirillum sp. OGB3 TaxID=2587012 RepID=UPI0016061BE5|nr:hypothetical protein [Azospirillum sp. OGB3]MBB3268731.1 hypothetical protein [Azospirillum sp. OGB3]